LNILIFPTCIFSSHSSITIGFKEHQFVAMERGQLFGPTELVAQFGGLLGLFLGFSLMSVMELVYFCTIRLICDLKNALSERN
jgi:acid-sensing ion channel, other